MTLRTLSLPLKGFGRPPSQAEVVVRSLATGERFRRAGLPLGAGVGAALITLPIPIVHLVFPPVALVAGVVGSALRFRQREVFQRAEASCPFCQTRQRLNLAGSGFRLPQNITCVNCLQPLRLETQDPARPAA
jgi:hypothetical protein